MLQLNITGTVQFSQNFIGQNITSQELVSVNVFFSRITAVFPFKRFLEYEFLSILSIHGYTSVLIKQQNLHSLLIFSSFFVYSVYLKFPNDLFRIHIFFTVYLFPKSNSGVALRKDFVWKFSYINCLYCYLLTIAYKKLNLVFLILSFW